jgi:hypothetical protein
MYKLLNENEIVLLNLLYLLISSGIFFNKPMCSLRSSFQISQWQSILGQKNSRAQTATNL